MSREELFARRSVHGTNNGSSSWRSNGEQDHNNQDKKEHASIAMDEYMSKEHGSLVNTHREVDDMLTQGADIIGNLRHQRDVLKGARTKMLDIGNMLGLSNSVMQYIEKRASKDKIILFGGMLLFTIFMFLFWLYFL